MYLYDILINKTCIINLKNITNNKKPIVQKKINKQLKTNNGNDIK